MSVLVGYVPTPEGASALEQAIQQATLRSTSLLVVNVAIGSNYADVTFADEKDLDAVRARLTAFSIHTAATAPRCARKSVPWCRVKRFASRLPKHSAPVARSLRGKGTSAALLRLSAPGNSK